MTTAVAPRHLPFDNGDVMTREEFHRLLNDREELERFELIEGVVYFPSRVPHRGHAEEHMWMLTWLNAYCGDSVTVTFVPCASILLDEANEPFADAMLIREDLATYDDGYLTSPPELILEIAASSAARDLHQKKRAYERNGVREYIVWRTRDKAIDWFRLEDGAYVRVEPDRKGIIESTEFPGLRLDTKAMLVLDRKKVLAALH